jgi:SAM-dependent methyltransferase
MEFTAVSGECRGEGMTYVSGTNWRDIPLSNDDAALDFEAIGQGDCAGVATLDDVLAKLRSPDDHGPLSAAGGALRTASGSHTYPMIGPRPVLLPAFARDAGPIDRLQYSPQTFAKPGLQYLLLSAIKAQGGPQNSDYSDIWFKRHVHRSRKLLAGARGLTLDIGCDKPSISSRLYPPTATFLGLEPSQTPSEEFCLCGIGECLPLIDASVDNVVFMTSLDHVLDYNLAVEEARRVLKPGGMLYLASLVWTHDAGLLRDTVHFHHFREYQLRGALEGLVIEQLDKYRWKNDEHRYGIYLSARKPS